MEGLFQEFIAAGWLSPAKPLACHLFFPIWPPCFTRNICCLFWGFPVLRSPDAAPTARLDFFLLLPSQMQVLQLSLRCLHPCILSFMEIACHPRCCEPCLWFWATARVTRSAGGWASLEGAEGPPWLFPLFPYVVAHIQSLKRL